jgi:hypothetical protein
MWMVDPKFLCHKHLLGEHGEIHKHKHNFVKGHKMDGRLSPVVQIEPSSMQERHDALAEEMVRRGFNHKSPYEQPDLSQYPARVVNARVNVREAHKDLLSRCSQCQSQYDRNLVETGDWDEV